MCTGEAYELQFLFCAQCMMKYQVILHLILLHFVLYTIKELSYYSASELGIIHK